MYKFLKQRLFRYYLFCGAHIHVRHWRGHGIHSPLVYGIVRHVFMKKGFLSADHALYETLLQQQVGHSSAQMLQNLYTHLHSTNYQLFAPGNSLHYEKRPAFCIMMPDTTQQEWISVARALEGESNRLVILAPHRTTYRWRFAQSIQDALHCVSIDRRTMMIYLFDPKLYKQHYRI